MNLNTKDHESNACPKRVWVMATLADDESFDLSAELPRALQLHLATCSSCKELADSLLVVSAGLGALGRDEPSRSLVQAANDQAKAALAAGGRMTGRVDVPDEPERAHTPTRRVLAFPATWLAAAASVAIFVGLFGAWWLIRSPDGMAQDRVTERATVPHTNHNARPDAKPGPKQADFKTGERLAEVDDAPNTEHSQRVRICNHADHLDAAMCDRIDAVHRAAIPPVRSRDRRPRLDTPEPGVFTKSAPNDR